MSRRGRERAGRAAETLAAWLLRLRGYRILARRQATPVGEIDLVARRGDLVVFVEVKRRPRTGSALEALAPRQQRRIARAAAFYLQHRPRLVGCAVRFDLVAVAPWRLPRHVADVWREPADWRPSVVTSAAPRGAGAAW